MSDGLWLLLVVGDVADLDLSVGLRRAVRVRHDAFDADVRLQQDHTAVIIHLLL